MRILRQMMDKEGVMKRGAAFFLAWVMLFSAVPVQAFAEGDASAPTEELLVVTGEEEESEVIPTEDTSDATEPSTIIEATEATEAREVTEAAETTEATEATEAAETTETTEATEAAETTEATEPTQESQPVEPQNITNSMGQLTLSLREWWFASRENTLWVGEERIADLSAFAQSESSPEWAGLTVHLEADAVQPGDWFTILLPPQLKQVRLQENFQPLDTLQVTLEVLNWGTLLTVRFCQPGTASEALPLEFQLTAGEPIPILLQEDGENKNAYTILLPLAEAEQETQPEEDELGDIDLEAAALEEALLGIAAPMESMVFALPRRTALAAGVEEDEPVLLVGEAENDTFSISGKIAFSETVDGIDWKGILRPLEFDQPIKIVLTYQDSEGAEHTATYPVQEDSSHEDYYLEFEHDGSGAGSFEIFNVPKTVTVDSVEQNVTKYSVIVEPKLPYYRFESGIDFTTPESGNPNSGTLTLGLNTQTVALQPTVKPETGDTVQFQMAGEFTNTATGKKSSNSFTISYPQSKEVEVPVGIHYSFTQAAATGYKFDGNYTTKISTEENPDTSKKAEGTIAADVDVTITTVNYAQNLQVSFGVKWFDKNRVDRPKVTEENKDMFILQYKTGENDWKAIKDLTEEELTKLDITVPALDLSKAGQNQYSFKGLPAVDTEGNLISYQVTIDQAKVPNGYFFLPLEVENGSNFNFYEETSFNASICWNDNENEGGGRRPGLDAIDNLNLYRRVDDGSYEPVTTVDVKNYITTGGAAEGEPTSSWAVTIPNLPRYDEDNKEYDYVLIHGSIAEDGTKTHLSVTNYRYHYNNVTSAYADDTDLCHNGGTIYEVYYDSIDDFTATKIWQDNEGDVRPTAKVSLWQYVAADATGIDDALSKGVAWPVVYVNDENEGKILSYTLRGTENKEEIIFDTSTGNFELPRYDDMGREYVYFVKETPSGTNADNYLITYQTPETAHQNLGAGYGGIVYNTRRQKAAVSVTKTWQDPTGLENVAGTTVRLKIKAPLVGGEELHELQVYSPDYGSYDLLNDAEAKEAQTVSGFTAHISSSEVTYYVNTYNQEGKPYDMTKAVFEETVTKAYEVKDGKVTIGGKEYQANGNSVTIDGTDYEIQNGKVYVEHSVNNGLITVGDRTYIPLTVVPDGTENGSTQYSYRQTNTVTGTRNYTLTKKWNNISEGDVKSVQSVNFKLVRRSTKTNADGKVPDYVVVTDTAHPDGIYSIPAPTQESFSHEWSTVFSDLPKYDEYGYEYLYSATEISVTIDGKEVKPSEKGWTVDHHRTSDGTTATNSIYTPSTDGYFYVSKDWQDSNDTGRCDQVAVRVYGRTALKEKLADLYLSQDDNTNVKLSDLENNLSHQEYTITEGGQWRTAVYYSAISVLVTGDESSTDLDNYIVLEYSVGNGPAAEYTLGQLRTAADTPGTYAYAGTVTYLAANADDSRMYNITAAKEQDSRNIIITNSRTGIDTITVTKTWKDESDRTGVRPDSIQFQLYQDGGKYTNIPSTVGVTAVDAVATLDYDNGIVTLSKEPDATSNGGAADPKNVWKCTLSKLPMLSAAGVTYSYNVEEIPFTLAGQSETSYHQEKTETVVTGDGTGQNFAFNFENTISGLKSHVAYKFWQDPDTSRYRQNRPDLSFSLYRYKAKDQEAHRNDALEELDTWEPYLDFKDQIWTTEPKTDEGKASDDIDRYDWKITVEDLPAFDSDGNQWVYVFTEWMNNNGETVLGTYQPYGETKPKGTSDSYEVFTNTITGEMTISGQKTWTGLTGFKQVTADMLPDPTITLYRTTDSTITSILGLTDDEVKQYLDEGKIELVDTTELDSTKRKYSFPDKSVTQDELDEGLIVAVVEDGVTKYMLPKFDSKGDLFTYLIRETIDDPIASQLYVQTTASGTLENRFKDTINRRSITVTKNWAGRDGITIDGENKYPSVTYTLYRYIIGDEQMKPEYIESHKIGADKFTNGTASWTFDNLLVYSPTGQQYGYYIVEAPISGYTASYIDENFINENAEDLDKAVDGTSFTKRQLLALKNNDWIDVVSLPENWNQENAANDVAVSTTNTYLANSIENLFSISGDKIWNDYFNAELLRPESVTLKLYRSTANENGQTNAINEVEVPLSTTDNGTAPYIVWTNEGDNSTAGKWSFEIHNLKRYAPNGMPYHYRISEEMPEGSVYQNSGDVTRTAPQSGNISGANITNSFTGSCFVRKNWMDGSNRYNLRPANITVKLQRKIEGGDWCDIPASGGMPSVLKGTDGKPIVSVTLTKANVMENTKGNSWIYTFDNLPMKDANRNAYTYRCQEVKIGGVAVEEQNNKLVAGAYVCRYFEQLQDGKITITNTLNSTSLVVTKKWEGDQEDLYHSRPQELTFVLQKKGFVQNENGETVQTIDWTPVMLANGNPYTFTISASDNWTKTLDYLPVVEIVTDASGNSYSVYSLNFRAVEVTDTKNENGQSIILGVHDAYNYLDITGYGEDSTAHKYNNTLSRNESTITNQLILDNPIKNIEVTKNWKRQPGQVVTATFELLYKTTQEGENAWHCFGNHSITDSWEDHTEESGCLVRTHSATGTSTATLTKWTNLPKYDRQGNELEYKVVEHPISGYKTESQVVTTENATTTYTFTNIELQSYTVEKVWQNTDYAEKTASGFTAEFKLQQKIGDGEWTDVQDAETCTLTSTVRNDNTKSYTWRELPKYTTDGKEITYRVVETKINGKDVENNTNGSYIVTYQYDNDAEPAFANTKTVATNRMVYGFVNLSKAAAYLAPSVAADGDKKLEGVVFDIYSGTDTSVKAYVSNVKTDANGNLCRNEDGTYGDEHKYLISGTYTLMEHSTNPGYSVWRNGVTFTVGTNGGDTDTGEHGTAWISTNTLLGLPLSLKVEYKHREIGHTFSDQCAPMNSAGDAYNLESRGIIEFTKAGPNGENLDTHANASGESKAYFGVYTDTACTNQVTGMMAGTDGKTMVLTTLDKDGVNQETQFCAKKNNAGIPYLRVGTDNSLSLLSGTYYLKELVAPPGYKLDNIVRKAVVPKIKENDGSIKYADNKAKIVGVDEAIGDLVYLDNVTYSYQWLNTENQLTLYKRDQYGRVVSLGENYLELKVVNGEGENKTFLTGEDTIRLYQNQTTPAKDKNGNEFAVGKRPNISYNPTDGFWTIKGLFDSGKTYTISEPTSPANYINAKEFSFTMDSDGKITVTSTDAEAKDIPLAVTGNNYKNYYKSDSANNVVVLRDVARYLTDVGLVKVDSTDDSKKIAYISFKLYKYSEKDANNPINSVSVLPDNTLLTTDENGVILLSKEDYNIDNLVTGCKLHFGLDVGKYYFQEVEHGASDSYRLLDKIFFEVKPKTPTGENPGYQDYAEVVFETATNGPVSQTGDSHSATVKNTPVIEKAKTLALTKVDSKNDTQKLSGARFTLTYTSKNNGQPGAQGVTTYNCKTDTDGVLYLLDENGNFKFSGENKIQPDISKKGSYVLVETKAPDYYMTRTDSAGNPVTLVTFNVDSDNIITNVKYNNGGNTLVSEGNSTLVSDVSITSYDGTTEHKELNLTVKNEKTVVSIAKRNDMESGTKTSNQKSLNGEPLPGATLEIYEGVYDENPATPQTAVWTSPNTSANWNVDPGKLKENTIYTLHEKEAPVGYLEADDIYFKLSGTTMKGDDVVSQLYVWKGSGVPSVVTGNDWVKTVSIQNTVLTMVDEAIIAPLNLQKVVGDGTSGYQALPGAKFEVKSLDGTGTVLGTAVTDSTGHLVWESIQANNGLIFNASGANTDSVIGHTIILRQNSNGYQFKEIYAPDNAYNDGRCYQVKITDKNYRDYRDGTTRYDSDKYINIVEAASKSTNTVDSLSTRNNQTTFADSAGLAVNAPYKSTVTLHKYDADEEANKAAIPGTQFTLYHAAVNGGTWTKGDPVGDCAYAITQSEGENSQYTLSTDGTFTTDASGNLSIEIRKKGSYILEETQPATAYQLNEAAVFQFTLLDKAEEGVGYGYDGKNALKLDDTGAPNQRLKGTVTLLKQDGGTGEKLNGVVYTLTRTDIPTPTPTDYLLKVPKDVTTGKVYEAKKEETGWTWTETDGGVEEVGVIKLIGLNWGTYELVEKTELSGYVKSDVVYRFTVSKDNLKPIFQSQTSNKVTNTKNQVTFHKTDDAATPKDLPGTVFEVHQGESCGTACKKVSFYTSIDRTTKYESVTCENGTVTIYGLPTDPSSDNPTSYHLVETTAPKGYKLANPIPFTVSRDGTIQVNNADVTEIVMKDEPIKLFITKNGKKFGGEDTITLPGAVFKLTDICAGNCDHKLANGNTEETVTTGENGKVMIPIERVIAGHTYRLEETKAPDGYECTAVVTFSVNEKGEATLVSFVGASVSLDDAKKDTFTITDEKIGIKLTKVDYDSYMDDTITDIPLAGVQFTMVPTTGSSFIDSFTSADGVVREPTEGVITKVTLTTNSSGKVIIPDGLVKHDNLYILTETDLGTNTGYRFAEDESDRQITFKVEKDGTISITSPNGMFQLAQGDNTALVVMNERIKLRVSKVDQATGAPLPGVTMKLQKVGDSTWADVVWTTSEEPTNNPKEIPILPGEYTLTETSTPDGYNSIGGSLTFVIDLSGKVTSAKVGKDDWTDLTKSNQNFTISNPTDGKPGEIGLTVTNAKYSDLKITKQGSDGVLLHNVKFKLEYLDNSGNPISDKTVSAETGSDDVNNGIVIFSGLPDGEYRLTELKTAAGYNLLSAPLEIEINRNSGTYTVKSNGAVISGNGLQREGDTILLTVINQKGLVLPATGTTTPQLPKVVLWITALLEGLVLYLYQTHGKRRKRETK